MQKIGFCERYMLTTAVLNKTKEMTRSLEKALERAVEEYEQLFGMPFSVCSQKWDAKKKCLSIWTPKSHIELKTRYKLGEVVAVAQAYKDTGLFDIYRGPEDTKGWNNKLFVKPDLMPHQIQMTDVSIERLQAISDDDCFKEGVLTNQFGDYWFKGFSPQKVVASMTPREAFAALINRPGVGRKGLWESNPWVVCYSFQLVK